MSERAAKVADRALTPRERAFVMEYLVDRSQTEAAARAGYRGKRETLRTIGWELMLRPNVRAAIEEAEASLRARVGITQERVANELALIAFARMSDFGSWGPDRFTPVESSELADGKAAAVAQIKVDKEGNLQIKLHDKQAALTQLGRHLGMFTDKIEFSVNNEAFLRILGEQAAVAGLSPDQTIRLVDLILGQVKGLPRAGA